MSYIGRQNLGGAYRQLDDISSGFDGSDTTHTMQVNSQNVTVGDVNQIILSLGGVIQKPGTDFTVSGSTLTFTTAPASGLSFFAMLLGSDNGGTVTPTDSSVTSAKLSGNLVTPGTLDLNGQELILDADADTSITADTDDQIDFKIAGSDKLSISSAGTLSLTSGNLEMDDTQEIRLGTGNDFVLNFSGTDSIIDHTPGSGGLYVRSDALLLQTSESTPFTMIRYDSGGNVKIFTDSSNLHSLDVNNDNASPEGIEMRFSGAAPDDATAVFFECNDTGTTRLKINSDGDVLNHDNAYTSISDERIKQDIRDANSQWDDIKAVRVRNFKKKDDVRQYGDNAWEQIGVIAQELETVSPKLIKKNRPSSGDILSDSSFGTLYTSDDVETQGDNPTANVGDVKEVKDQIKAVNYSILYMKAIKALQEAMAKIETLEADVKTLKGE